MAERNVSALSASESIVSKGHFCAHPCTRRSDGMGSVKRNVLHFIAWPMMTTENGRSRSICFRASLERQPFCVCVHRNAEQRFQATIAFFSTHTHTQFLQIVHNTSVIQFLRSMPSSQSTALLPDFYRKTFNSIRIYVVSLSSFPMKSELFKISKKKNGAQHQTPNQFALPDRWPSAPTPAKFISILTDLS